jgi:hypothetical protein
MNAGNMINEPNKQTSAFILTFVDHISHIHHIYHIQLPLRVPPIRDLQHQRSVLDRKRRRKVIVGIHQENV